MSENRVKFTFTSNGTSLRSIYIRPRAEVKLVRWSFTEQIPDAYNKTYFVSIANGIETKPFAFDVTLKTEKQSGPLMDITLISMKFDRKNDYTVDFRKVLQRVPDWSFAMDSVAGVTGYIF